MTDPRETAVAALQQVQTLLAQADHDPETPAGAAIERSLLVIAEALGQAPESATLELPQ